MNEDGVAVVAETAQERLGHGPVAEEVRPFVIDEIGCNDCGVATVTLLHQFDHCLNRVPAELLECRDALVSVNDQIAIRLTRNSDDDEGSVPGSFAKSVR